MTDKIQHDFPRPMSFADDPSELGIHLQPIEVRQADLVGWEVFIDDELRGWFRHEVDANVFANAHREIQRQFVRDLKRIGR